MDAAEVDHRLALRQRLPGERANQLIIERKIKPVLMRTFPFAECPVPHQMMRDNAHLGKMVVLVGAEEPGLGVSG